VRKVLLTMRPSTQEADDLDWAPMAVLLTVVVSILVIIYLMLLAPVPVAAAGRSPAQIAQGDGMTR
jgi:hypothetical protein